MVAVSPAQNHPPKLGNNTEGIFQYFRSSVIAIHQNRYTNLWSCRVVTHVFSRVSELNNNPAQTAINTCIEPLRWWTAGRIKTSTS